jgi:hypothetical protein
MSSPPPIQGDLFDCISPSTNPADYPVSDVLNRIEISISSPANVDRENGIEVNINSFQ